MTYFQKILIANRGEIAIRIIRACHELGIRAVAVYSEADRTAMHVREADEAYLIGPAAAAESYLKQSALIELAKRANCEAIHPGYGFLAENASFAALCETSGLTFIGSSAQSIRLLGNKVESRITMAQAGIPLIPGTDHATALDDKSLTRAADAIGYPVLVKAAAGGGGKGMRVVHSPKDLSSSLEAARRESQAAFGDPTVFLEKYLVDPRHVEFQTFGDKYGNRIHLFERECSIQRRHQKIIEETPSPALDDDLRQRMGQVAVKVVEVAKYYNAGTVEFLLDRDRNFYFLEVNTRIQVEHPVTEELLGVDLVCEQIRVAAGEELSWAQNDLTHRGHAIECRLYAEDPAAGFLPSAGPILFLKEPSAPGIRFDAGVETGDEVSVYYDPIIAKLIAWGTDRQTAVKRALIALDNTVILGLTTNRDFLRSILSHPHFQSGELHTNFIPQHLPQWRPEITSIQNQDLAIGVASITSPVRSNSVPGGVSKIPDPWNEIGKWQLCGGR